MTIQRVGEFLRKWAVRDGRAVGEASSRNTSFGAARAGAGVARVPVLKSRCILAPLMMIGNASRARPTLRHRCLAAWYRILGSLPKPAD